MGSATPWNVCVIFVKNLSSQIVQGCAKLMRNGTLRHFCENFVRHLKSWVIQLQKNWAGYYFILCNFWANTSCKLFELSKWTAEYRYFWQNFLVARIISNLSYLEMGLCGAHFKWHWLSKFISKIMPRFELYPGRFPGDPNWIIFL